MKKQIFNINLDIEKLPDGYYVATSKDVPGLVAQGKTFEEVVEIAEDIAKVLLKKNTKSPKLANGRIFYPISVAV